LDPLVRILIHIVERRCRKAKPETGTRQQLAYIASSAMVVTLVSDEEEPRRVEFRSEALKVIGFQSAIDDDDSEELRLVASITP
jgi:hypothetical protein